MLVRDDGTSWTAITQPAHAHLAGQVAVRWAEPLHPDVVLGIEQHDVPWRQWDLEPPLHAEHGRAAAFFETPTEPRLQLWEGATRHLEAQSPYAAVLVSLHATNIHTRYGSEDDRPKGLLERARADQDRLLATLPDRTREQAVRDADLLFALDALSLVLCHGWEGRDLPPVGGTTFALTTDPNARWATLDPWPLAGDEVTLRVPERTFTQRFDDEAALHAALRTHPYDELVWTLSRP